MQHCLTVLSAEQSEKKKPPRIFIDGDGWLRSGPRMEICNVNRFHDGPAKISSALDVPFRSPRVLFLIELL